MSAIPVSLAESYSWRSGVDDIRACLFCVHGNDEIAPLRRCGNPHVTGATTKATALARTVDCHVARAPTGPCGVEARFLHIRGE